MKKSLQIKLFAILTLIFALSFSNIQAKEIKIKGQIIDSTTLSPVKMSIVSVVNSNNAILFTAIVESDSANFEFNKIKIDKGRYQVVVSNGSYYPKSISFDDESVKTELDLGKITLKANQREIDLEKVVVTGDRKTQVSVDKTTYVVDSALLKNVSTSTDLMRKIPELAVDEIKRKIRIMGKENTLVLLNGINSGTSVDMRSIDFRDIEKIEVVTLPSSSVDVDYDGVVNIVLKPKVRKGVSIDLEESAKLNGRSNDTYLGIMWGAEKLRLKFTYDNYYRANSSNIEQQRTDEITGKTYSQEGYAPKPRELSNNFRLNMDYHITPRDFFNITTSTKFSRSNKNIGYSAYNINAGIRQELTPFDMHLTSDYFVGNYTLYYRHSMKNKSKDYISINANFGVMNGTEGSETKYENKNPYFINDELADKFSTSLKIDYNNTLSKVFNLNIGTQGYFQNFRGTLNDLPNKNNLKNYRYNVYADLNASVNKFQFGLGIKGEGNTNVFEDKTYGSNTQPSFIPSAAVIYKINKQNTLKAEYRSPAYYPSAWMMAPYELRLDEKTINRGNPDLKLTRYNTVELTHTYRTDNITINTTPYYVTSNNSIITENIIDSDLNTIRTFANGGNLKNAGVRINGSLNFFSGAISIDPEINLAYENMALRGVTQRNFHYRLGGTVMLSFPLGFACGAYGAYQNKTVSITGYNEPNYSVDVFIMKSFEKLNLNIFAGYEALAQSGDVSYTFGEKYLQRDYFKFNSKGFVIRLNYYFMSGKSSRMEKVRTYFDDDRK